MIQPSKKSPPNQNQLIASDESTKSKNAVKNADQIDAKATSKAPHELTVLQPAPIKAVKAVKLKLPMLSL